MICMAGLLNGHTHTHTPIFNTAIERNWMTKMTMMMITIYHLCSISR